MKRAALITMLAALVLTSSALGWAGITRAQAVARAAQGAALITFADNGVDTNGGYTASQLQREILMFERHSYTATRVRCGKTQAWRVAWPKAWLVLLGTLPEDATPYFVTSHGIVVC